MSDKKVDDKKIEKSGTSGKRPKNFPKTFRNLSENFQKTFRKVPEKFPKTFHKLSEIFSKNFPKTFRKLTKNFPKASQKLFKNFPKTSWNLFKKLSENFPKTFQKLSKNFPKTSQNLFKTSWKFRKNSGKSRKLPFLTSFWKITNTWYLSHYLTRDVLPAEHNYRNLLSLDRQNPDTAWKYSRPTLDELHYKSGELNQKLLPHLSQFHMFNSKYFCNFSIIFRLLKKLERLTEKNWKEKSWNSDG